jgi:TPR repeat protein
MKKIFFSLLLIVGILNANNNQQQKFSILQNSLQSDKNIKVKTFAEYARMEALLKAAYNSGDDSKAFILGSLYLKEYNLKDATIKPDTKKALKWFKIALKKGYGLASLQIAILESFPRKEYFTALETLEKGIRSKFIDLNGKQVLAVAYGSVVLDHLNGSHKYIRKALDIIYPIVSLEALSSLDYIFANLLNLDNQTKLANKYLNSACNNPRVPPEIWNICIQGKEIKTLDKKTGQLVKKDNETNCPVSKLMPGYK